MSTTKDMFENRNGRAFTTEVKYLQYALSIPRLGGRYAKCAFQHKALTIELGYDLLASDRTQSKECTVSARCTLILAAEPQRTIVSRKALLGIFLTQLWVNAKRYWASIA